MSSKQAKERLDQVQDHLKGSEELPLALRFQPALPKGLPPHITPLNPVSFLLKAATIRPHHPAIIHPEKNFQYTYEEFATRVARLVYAFRSRGVKPGDRIFVLAPNTPMAVEAQQAIPAAQGIIVAVNTRLTASEISYMIENSGATIALVDSEYIHLVDPKLIEIIRCEDSGLASDPYEQFLLQGLEFDRKQTNGPKGWRGIEFQADENATMNISYTSGTTSLPKGVETTYRGTFLAALANATETQMDFDTRYLWILPLFHILGWAQSFASTSAMGTQIMLRGVGNYDQVWKGFLERGVTHYAGAPTVQLSIVSHPWAKRLDRIVRTNVAGAAPTPTVIKGLEDLNIDVTHVYGLTETYGPVTRVFFLEQDKNSPDYYVEKARQGHAFRLNDDIRVVRLIPEGQEDKVKEGDLVDVACDGQEVGEIVMRGSLVMKGYYKNEKATKKAMAGGWFHSGDLATRKKDGTFQIQDRSKDIIISGGENISSLSIENILTTHPDIHEVACVARAHDKYGERPHSFVVLKPGANWVGRHAEFEQEIKKFSRGKMPGFAIPEWVEIVPELIKTSTGKVQKNLLRDKLKSLLGKN